MTRRECIGLAAAMVTGARVVRAQPVVKGTPTAADEGDYRDLSQLRVFPANNPWNTDISTYPVHPNSGNFLASIGLAGRMHADFGTVWEGAPNGIPYIAVPLWQRRVNIEFTEYADESDPGPYPVPAGAPVEGGPLSNGDRHVLVVDTHGKKLYELYLAFPNPDGSWRADCGAVYDLTSNNLRPDYWTSADAAGLPIFPGLVRYDECVQRRAILHALRFTVQRTQRGFIHPATHYASDSEDPNRPPMGLRLRLRPGVSEAAFPFSVRPIVAALKRFGMMVADNGSNWYLSGAPDPRWSDDDLAMLSQIRGSDFDVVQTGAIIR